MGEVPSNIVNERSDLKTWLRFPYSRSSFRRGSALGEVVLSGVKFV